MRTVAALFVAWPLVGCLPGELPGEPVAAFSVTGELLENSCGAQAVAAVDPLRFEVELRADDALAYWHRPGFPAVAGSRSEDSFEFRHRSSVTVIAPELHMGVLGCVLEVEETITVTLDESERTVIEDAPPEEETEEGDMAEADTADSDSNSESAEADPSYGLNGINTVGMQPAVGSNCAPILAAWGGVFLAMPCQLEYDLAGESLPIE